MFRYEHFNINGNLATIVLVGATYALSNSIAVTMIVGVAGLVAVPIAAKLLKLKEN